MLQVVAKGPVWEFFSIEGELDDDVVGEAAGCETRVQGALSLLVELDQVRRQYEHCSRNVFHD